MAERLSCKLLEKKFNQELNQENRRLRVQFPLRAYITNYTFLRDVSLYNKESVSGGGILWY